MKLSCQIGRCAGWWCVRYRRDRAWGRNHYGSLLECLACWTLVRAGRAPLTHMRPYDQHL